MASERTDARNKRLTALETARLAQQDAWTRAGLERLTAGDRDALFSSFSTLETVVALGKLHDPADDVTGEDRAAVRWVERLSLLGEEDLWPHPPSGTPGVLSRLAAECERLASEHGGEAGRLYRTGAVAWRLDAHLARLMLGEVVL